MIRVIVAGSRTITDRALVASVLDQALAGWTMFDVAIVSGMAAGPDLLGKQWADANEFSVIEVPANWDGLGKSAGFLRNTIMADIADCLIVQWDGVSRGTRDMINKATERGLVVLQVNAYTALLHNHEGAMALYPLDAIKALSIPQRRDRVEDYQPLIDAHWQKETAIVTLAVPDWVKQGGQFC